MVVLIGCVGAYGVTAGMRRWSERELTEQAQERGPLVWGMAIGASLLPGAAFGLIAYAICVAVHSQAHLHLSAALVALWSVGAIFLALALVASLLLAKIQQRYY